MKLGGDSPAYQVFMLALCIYALVALGAEAAYPAGSEIQQLLTYADTSVCALFFADFCVSLYRAENRWRYFYTWGWLDLLSSIPTLDARAVGQGGAHRADRARAARHSRDQNPRRPACSKSGGRAASSPPRSSRCCS